MAQVLYFILVHRIRLLHSPFRDLHLHRKEVSKELINMASGNDSTSISPMQGPAPAPANPFGIGQHVGQASEAPKLELPPLKSPTKHYYHYYYYYYYYYYC